MTELDSLPDFVTTAIEEQVTGNMWRHDEETVRDILRERALQLCLGNGDMGEEMLIRHIQTLASQMQESEEDYEDRQRRHRQLGLIA